MEEIALEKKNQKKLKKKTKSLKGKILAGNVKIRAKNLKRKPKLGEEDQRGVIYIGSIPHGFYEDELKSYFQQFGVVTKVKVGRSKKTGRSKGFAFVEFLHSEVAKIAAEAMNNYLMYNCLLKCQYKSPGEQHSGMFMPGITETNYPRKRNREKQEKEKNKLKTEAQELAREIKTKRKIEKLQKLFQKHGIEHIIKVNSDGITVDDVKATESNSANDISNDGWEGKFTVDEENVVMVIDESDDDIRFLTPPNVKKIIIKKSSKKTSGQSKKLFRSKTEKGKKRKIIKTEKTQTKAKKTKKAPKVMLKSRKKKID